MRPLYKLFPSLLSDGLVEGPLAQYIVYNVKGIRFCESLISHKTMLFNSRMYNWSRNVSYYNKRLPSFKIKLTNPEVGLYEVDKKRLIEIKGVFYWITKRGLTLTNPQDFVKISDPEFVGPCFFPFDKEGFEFLATCKKGDLVELYEAYTLKPDDVFNVKGYAGETFDDLNDAPRVVQGLFRGLDKKTPELSQLNHWYRIQNALQDCIYLQKEDRYTIHLRIENVDVGKFDPSARCSWHLQLLLKYLNKYPLNDHPFSYEKVILDRLPRFLDIIVRESESSYSWEERKQKAPIASRRLIDGIYFLTFSINNELLYYIPYGHKYICLSDSELFDLSAFEGLVNIFERYQSFEPRMMCFENIGGMAVIFSKDDFSLMSSLLILLKSLGYV